ncbi:MAG: putative ABC transporter permease [Bacilli bacterium]
MIYNILFCFLIFMIYSFIGWFLEVIAVLAVKKRLMNRGFLLGPYCPIYGFGGLILLLVLDGFKNDPINLFVIFAVYASILEYLVSYLMERFFKARWWDYSHIKFNLNGRICLSNALLFGFLGLLIVFFFNPFLLNVLRSIDQSIIIVSSSILFVILIIDCICTFNIVTKIKKTFINKSDNTEELNEKIKRIIKTSHIVKAFPLIKEKIFKKVDENNEKI